MKKTPIHPSGTGWAQACLAEGAHRYAFIAGQVPIDADGQVPTDIADQCRAAWANVKKQLGAADMTLQNLLSVRIYLTDRKYIPEMIAVRNEVLGLTVEPAFTVVIADLYDESWVIEIETVAAA